MNKNFAFFIKMEENMTKKIFTFSLVLGVSIILSACEMIETPQPTAVVYESSSDNSLDLIIAEGEVVPAKDMQILSLYNATVEEIFIEEGKLVEEGEVILRFEIPEQLSAELRAAELEQLKASQALDDLNRYGNLQKQKAYQRVLDAQTAHRAAVAAWDEFDQDQYDEDLEAIKEEVIDAKSELDDAKEDLKEFLDLEEDNTLRKNRQDDVDDAQLSLNELGREQEQLEQEYEQLQLNLDLTKAELDTAWEEYRKFQQNDVPADQLELAEQQVTTANAKVAAIHASIEDLSITAPFDGTLVKIDVKERQSVHAGQILAVIADFSTCYVESTDITELDIVNFALEDMVTIEFDAFPGESVRGKVIEINDFPEIKFNDVIYRVSIELTDHDLPLHWKMSTIIKKQK
jgi:multidrug resistance efflux pump